MADSRDTLLGIDTTGAEYWLVPRPVSAPGGHRMIEVRKSKKQVPKQLEGLWTGGDAAQRAFESWMTSQKAAKKVKAKPEKAES